MVGRRGRAAVLAVVVAAWGVAAAPASAQRAADEAEQAYRLGYAALQAGDCAAALVHYRRSLELTRRPRTLFNMAVCEEELGLRVEAWRSYHGFLELAEPRDAGIVVKARARIAALRAVLRGKVTVESSPPGASVFVDGERQPRGATPVTLSLEPGAHAIRVARPDAPPAERTVKVLPDAVEVLSVTLALPARITVVVDPVDASIESPDGGAVGVGRYEVAVAPGRHVFTIRRDGWLSERLEVDAVAGRSHVERVRLRPVPAMATLVVAGVPGAAIAIDGQAVRATPTASGALELRALPAGAHQVVVAAAGRPPWRAALHLSPGEVLSVELDAPRGSPGRRSLAWGLGGLGLAGVTGGAVVGVLALRDVASPLPEEHDRGKRRALVADGLLVVGTVAVIAAWRWLRPPSPSATITRAHGAAP